MIMKKTTKDMYYKTRLLSIVSQLSDNVRYQVVR
jgi:hypothetical protein